jgi:diadenosine tetraphosphate (Ap4A) HIT family hydrolase
MALVSERAHTLAFVDPRPMQPGHLLVITKRHAPTLLDLSPAEAHEVIEHARDLAQLLVRALAAEGINAFQNNGVAAGQSVPHYHMHLLPRRAADANKFLSESSARWLRRRNASRWRRGSVTRSSSARSHVRRSQQGPQGCPAQHREPERRPGLGR